MATRKHPLVTDQFYHIYNRGVAKQPIFLSKRDYQQALLALSYYRFTDTPVKLSRFKELSLEKRQKIMTDLEKSNKLNVRVISFVLMPNHFHFLLQQTEDEGIVNFIGKFANSYTKYINTKTDRVGPLLQGAFKAVLVEDDEQLLHLSRYIHINPAVSLIIKPGDLSRYPWSSLPDYLKGESRLLWMEPVLGQFPTPKAYKDFLLDQVGYGIELEAIKHLILEKE